MGKKIIFIRDNLKVFLAFKAARQSRAKIDEVKKQSENLKLATAFALKIYSERKEEKKKEKNYWSEAKRTSNQNLNQPPKKSEKKNREKPKINFCVLDCFKTSTWKSKQSQSLSVKLSIF